MEIRLSIDEYADIPFIKKLLTQIKGVKNFELVNDEDKQYSLEEIEKSDTFKKVLDKSFEDFKTGKHIEHSDDLMDKVFGTK